MTAWDSSASFACAIRDHDFASGAASTASILKAYNLKSLEQGSERRTATFFPVPYDLALWLAGRQLFGASNSLQPVHSIVAIE